MDKEFSCDLVTHNPSNRITVPKSSRILHSSPSGIYALLIVMISMFLFSCDKEEPLVKVSQDMELPQNHTDLDEKIKFRIDRSNFKSVSIDTLKSGQGLSTRSSICDVEVSITKIGGNSTEYNVVIVSEGDSIEYFDGPVEPGTFGSNSETVDDIDETKSYDFVITPNATSTSEWFSIRITTPNLAYTYTFDLDTTDPDEKEGMIDGFDYFDCP